MFRCIQVFSLFFAAVLLLAGCTIKTQEHGYDFDNESLKNLKVTSSSKEEIKKVMGSPLAVSSLDNNTWYYISLTTKSVAILRPKISHYKVLELKFDKNNKLSEVALYTNDKIKKLDFKQWESPLRGSKNDLLQDFLYNMGRFNKANKTGGSKE